MWLFMEYLIGSDNIDDFCKLFNLLSVKHRLWTPFAVGSSEPLPELVQLNFGTLHYGKLTESHLYADQCQACTYALSRKINFNE